MATGIEIKMPASVESTALHSNSGGLCSKRRRDDALFVYDPLVHVVRTSIMTIRRSVCVDSWIIRAIVGLLDAVETLGCIDEQQNT